MRKLDGFKTYIVAAGAILTAVGAYLNGAMDAATLIQTIYAALLGTTIRHGMKTGAR